MAVFAANIEVDAMSMYKDVYNVRTTRARAPRSAKLLEGRERLQDAGGADAGRCANLSSQDSMKLIEGLKTLFHGEAIKKQYREGMMGRTGGFDFYENVTWPAHRRLATAE